MFLNSPSERLALPAVRKAYRPNRLCPRGYQRSVRCGPALTPPRQGCSVAVAFLSTEAPTAGRLPPPGPSPHKASSATRPEASRDGASLSEHFQRRFRLRNCCFRSERRSRRALVDVAFLSRAQEDLFVAAGNTAFRSKARIGSDTTRYDRHR